MYRLSYLLMLVVGILLLAYGYHLDDLGVLACGTLGVIGGVYGFYWEHKTRHLFEAPDIRDLDDDPQ